MGIAIDKINKNFYYKETMPKETNTFISFFLSLLLGSSIIILLLLTACSKIDNNIPNTESDAT